MYIMFVLLFICFYVNLYFSTSVDVNLSHPSPTPLINIVKNQVNTCLNKRASLAPIFRATYSKYALNLFMLIKLIIICLFLFHILIYCSLKIINSVRFVPYNYSTNQLNKFLKNSKPIFRNSVYFVIFLVIDSTESLIMILYFLSEIYQCNFIKIAASKIKNLASVKSIYTIGYIVILIVLSSNFFSHFFSFLLSCTVVCTISYWTFFVMFFCLCFTLMQSIWFWLMFVKIFIGIDDIMNIIFFTSQAICFFRLLFIFAAIKFLSFLYVIAHWLLSIKIILSNDVEKNPGDFINNFFTFCNWNLNSLAKDNFSRADLLKAHNALHKYDIISICETSLNDTVLIPEKMLENYKFISCNNPNNIKHGGVGLFYKDSLAIKIRDDISFDETLVVEIMIDHKNIFFTVLYRSPSNKVGSAEFNKFILDFNTLYVNIRKDNPYATFFTGDFNAHSELWWKDGDTNPEGKEIEDFTSLLGLKQLINEPTNMEPNKNPTCIDLILTDLPNIVMNCGVRPSLDNVCHHQMIFCNSNLKSLPPPSYKRKIWHYERAEIELIKRAVSNFPWEQHFFTNPDVNWQVESFTGIILNIMANFIPNEIKKINPRDPPWLTKPLRNMLKKQKRLFKNFKRHGYKIEDKTRVDAFSEECKLAIAVAKKIFINKSGSALADPNTAKKAYWKIVNKLMNKCKSPIIPPILVNNKFIINCKDKAILFAEFFSQQCKLITNNSILPIFHFITDSRFDTFDISNAEITLLIRKLNAKKANGPDKISSRMLILCDDTIVPPLKIIFNNILTTGVYPTLWKSANVTPIHKKNDKQSIKNYRPISLLPICAKIFEKIIFDQLYSHFTSNSLITNNQSGFISGDSTTNQLLELVNEIHKSFDQRNSHEVRSVFLDISKAFDKVWHEGLIHKLNQNGICGNALTFLKAYLRDRQQRVVLNGSCSEFLPIESGVPQGSVLGPLLFLIYINDLEKDIKSRIKFFADDTMLFSVVHNPLISANELNHDLKLINDWAFQWKMSFNPDVNKQAVEVLFSQKNKKELHPPLYFNGNKILRVKEHKHLGMILDCTLSFSSHIKEKIKITRKNIGILKFLSSHIPLKTLDQIYKLFIRPHFDYGDVIYHIPNKTNLFDSSITLRKLMDDIERVQYRAALAITGAWQGTNRNKLYEELGWESLCDRRWLRRLLQFYKIHYNMTPKYLKDNLPPLRQLLYGRTNPNIYHNIHGNTTRYTDSFFPDSIKSWNSLNNDLHRCNTIANFKSKLQVFIRDKPKPIFGIHDPIGLKHLFRLRLGLSPLKYDKFRHNFVDTINDTCECNVAPENVIHFIFKCPIYNEQRIFLMNCVSLILLSYPTIDIANNVKLFLYGDHLLSYHDNKRLILSTIKFIIDSNRFDT